MIFAPEPWSPFLVFSPRMTHVFFIRAAIFGISSEMCDARHVGLDRAERPAGRRAGLRVPRLELRRTAGQPEQDDALLRLLEIVVHIRRGERVELRHVRGERRAGAAGRTEERTTIHRVIRRTAEVRTWMESWREAPRVTWPSISITESELRRGHERPEHLPVGFRPRDPSASRRRPSSAFSFVRGRRAAVGLLHQELDRLLRIVHRLDAAERRAVRRRSGTPSSRGRRC